MGFRSRSSKFPRAGVTGATLERAAPTLGTNPTGGGTPVAIIVTDSGNKLYNLVAPSGDTSNPWTQGCTLGSLINGDFGYNDLSEEPTTNYAVAYTPYSKKSVNLSDATSLGGKVRDVLVCGPGHPWNPQTTGLNRDGGLHIINSRHVVKVGFTYAMNTDWVAVDGGIGQNVNGKGTKAIRNRLFKIQNVTHGGIVHIEGCDFGGSEVWEAINCFSTAADAGGAQLQRYRIGTVKWKALDIAGKTTGDAGYVAGAHDGGDTEQWQKIAGFLHFSDYTHVTTFQGRFRDDVSAQSGAGQIPTQETVTRGEVVSTNANTQGWFWRRGATYGYAPITLRDCYYSGPNALHRDNAGSEAGAVYMSGVAATTVTSITSGERAGQQSAQPLDGATALSGSVVSGRMYANRDIAPSSMVGFNYNPAKWVRDRTGETVRNFNSAGQSTGSNPGFVTATVGATV